MEGLTFMYNNDYSDDYEKTILEMSCFDNIVGIKRTCDDKTPISGLYINDIGINVNDADAAIRDEYASGLRMIKDKIAFSTNLIINHLRAGASKLLVKSNIASGNIGMYTENSVIPAVAGKKKGIQYRLKDYPYFAFRLNTVSFFAHETKIIEVYVSDLITGQLLDTIDMSVISGQVVTVAVNKKYLSGNKPISLFIWTDSDITHNQANLSKGHCSGCTTTFTNEYAYLAYSETESDTILEANLSGGSSTGGISINYSLECDLEPYLCSMAGTLGMPILYKSGVEIMDYIIHSKRKNNSINVYKEDHQALRDQFEMEYMASMKGIFDNMQTPKDVCFSCNSNIRFVSIAP